MRVCVYLAPKTPSRTVVRTRTVSNLQSQALLRRFLAPKRGDGRKCSRELIANLSNLVFGAKSARRPSRCYTQLTEKYVALRNCAIFYLTHTYTHMPELINFGAQTHIFSTFAAEFVSSSFEPCVRCVTFAFQLRNWSRTRRHMRAGSLRATGCRRPSHVIVRRRDLTVARMQIIIAANQST